MKQDAIHLVGIGGVGMGSLAEALANAGYQVTGSDQNLYDPMKGVLERAKIQLVEGFSADTPNRFSPDHVVIGNVVSKENPEVQAWLRKGTPFCSFPEAVRRWAIGNKQSVVVAGTHGKTTTTSWVAFLLKEAGLHPSYLIGGVPKDLPTGCLIGTGDYFVGEGDEYDSAFFDKGPKFLHYNPSSLILLNIEFDHADIYRDLDHVKSSFEKLLRILPGDGICVARYEDPVVLSILSEAICSIETFGNSAGAMWRLGNIEEDESGFHFEVYYKHRHLGQFHTAMFGEHNLLNLLSGIAVGVNLGIPVETIRTIVPKFQGAKRRQEILLRTPYTLIDDFAHHPTEVNATLTAVRRRYPEGRLTALFEPRSATARRNVHQQSYPDAFEKADRVLIAAPYRQDSLGEAERLSVDSIVKELCRQGKEAYTFSKSEEAIERIQREFTPGEVIVVMSNGGFDKIQEKIRNAVK